MSAARYLFVSDDGWVKWLKADGSPRWNIPNMPKRATFAPEPTAPPEPLPCRSFALSRFHIGDVPVKVYVETGTNEQVAWHAIWDALANKVGPTP